MPYFARAVIVCDRPDRTVNAATSAAWIRDLDPDVEVVETSEAPQPWAERTLELLGHVPGVTFTSEANGDEWGIADGRSASMPAAP